MAKGQTDRRNSTQFDTFDTDLNLSSVQQQAVVALAELFFIE
jgi:hypothetical protein